MLCIELNFPPGFSWTGLLQTPPLRTLPFSMCVLQEKQRESKQVKWPIVQSVRDIHTQERVMLTSDKIFPFTLFLIYYQLENHSLLCAYARSGPLVAGFCFRGKKDDLYTTGNKRISDPFCIKKVPGKYQSSLMIYIYM